jgi:hypothetical protein
MWMPMINISVEMGKVGSVGEAAFFARVSVSSKCDRAAVGLEKLGILATVIEVAPEQTGGPGMTLEFTRRQPSTAMIRR